MIRDLDYFLEELWVVDVLLLLDEEDCEEERLERELELLPTGVAQKGQMVHAGSRALSQCEHRFLS